MAVRVFDADAPDAVFAFLDATVSARGRDHWRWKYRVGTNEAPAAFYWEAADGRVLGFIGLMRTALCAGDQRFPAAWFVDWHVAPAGGVVGVGFGLLRQAEAAAGMLLTLQGSKDTRQILPRLGWKESTAPNTWILPLSQRFVADVLARQVPSWLRGPTRVAAMAVAPYLQGRRPKTRTDVALVDVDRFPNDYDAIWHARAHEHAPLMVRDAAYLNYLCADYPERGYRLQLVRAGAETIGHLITRTDDHRPQRRRGRIVDVFWPRGRAEVAAWLVRSACAQLRDGGVDYVECMASVPDLADVLRGVGFRTRNPVPLWYHRLLDGVPDPSTWYISFLDCDRAYR